MITAHGDIAIIYDILEYIESNSKAVFPYAKAMEGIAELTLIVNFTNFNEKFSNI